MPKTVTLRLDDETYELFSSLARAENRSLANYIETTVKNQICRKAFSGPTETDYIHLNTDLLGRIRTGTEQMVRRQGSFVE